MGGWTQAEWVLGQEAQNPRQGQVGITRTGWIGGAGLQAGDSGQNAGTKQAGHQTGTQEGGQVKG